MDLFFVSCRLINFIFKSNFVKCNFTENWMPFFFKVIHIASFIER